MSVIIEDVQGVDNCFSIESGILDSDTLKELTFREFLFLESIENRVLIEKAILNKKVSNLADVKQLIQSAAIIKQYPVIYLLIKKNALSFDQAVKLNILEKSILASNSDIIDDKMFDYVFVLKHHLLLAEINGSIKLQRIISSDKIYVQLVKHCCEHDIDALSCFINYAEQFLYGYNNSSLLA